MNTSFKRYSIAAELLTSVVYQHYMPTEIQPRYKTSIFALCLKPLTRRSLTPLFLYQPSHSLWLMKVELFIENALCGQQSVKIAQNIFIHIFKTTFCLCHTLFSLPSALNYRFSPVQNLYRFKIVVSSECCSSACQEIQKGFHMHVI